MNTPEHHRRYTIAWALYNDPYCNEKSRSILESEMDNAQNDFKWNEWQTFKCTLPGFDEHWTNMQKMIIKLHQKKFLINVIISYFLSNALKSPKGTYSSIEIQ